MNPIPRIILSCLMTTCFIKCKSYAINPMAAVEVKKTEFDLRQIDFKTSYTYWQKDYYRQVIDRVLNEYDPNHGKISNSGKICKLTISRIGRNEISNIEIIGVVTLFLIPLYESHRDIREIKIEYFINSELVKSKVYQFGFKAYLWLPLTISLFFERYRIEQPFIDMLDDFFYNELPKAGIQ